MFTKQVNFGTIANKENLGIIVEGVESNAYLGYAVSGAGDFNKDGYDDVITGARGCGVGGCAYIIKGGSPVSGTFNTTSFEGYTINGPSVSGGSFGAAVAGASDVNNDGYSDVIVGAPGNAGANIISNSGVAYVIFGGDNFPQVFNLDSLFSTLNGDNGFYIYGQENDQIGWQVNFVGDINNDNYEDIIVSSRNGARVYGIYGKSSFSSVVNLANSPESYGFLIEDASRNWGSDGPFFYSIAGVGDVNNDGYGDIVIGNPEYNNDRGIAYLIYGSNDLLSTFNYTSFKGVKLQGDISQSSYVGFSVGGAGDINGDGTDDFMVGSPLLDAPYNAQGAIYVVYGSNDLSNDIDLRYLNGTHGFTIIGNNYEDAAAGLSLSKLGDLNKDGLNDILISTYYPKCDSYFAASRGTNYILYGNNSFPANFYLDSVSHKNGLIIDGPLRTIDNIDDFAVFPTSSAGDINGDGYPDIVVGSPFEETNHNKAGRTFIAFLGKEYQQYVSLDNFVQSDGWQIRGYLPGGNMGFAVTNLGDINGDNIEDISFGAPEAALEGIDEAGQVYTLYGSPAFPSILNVANINSVGVQINGTTESTDDDIVVTSGSYLGTTLAKLGDINNDGYNDIGIGFGHGEDVLAVLLGGNNLPESVSLTSLINGYGFLVIGGSLSSSNFGQPFKGVGDVNGDGFQDFLVANIPSSSSNYVQYYIFYGKNSFANVFSMQNFNSSDGFIIQKQKTDLDNNFNVLGGAGDINNDGYNDIIITGTNSTDNQVFIIFGKSNFTFMSSLNDIADTKITIDYNNDKSFGYAVGGIGDINNDNIDDFIITSPWDNTNLYDDSNGIAYIVFGKEAFPSQINLSLNPLDGSNGFVIVGSYQDSGLGVLFSPAGDINKDGINDILIKNSQTICVPGDGGGTTWPNNYIIFGKESFEPSINIFGVTENLGINIASTDGSKKSGYSPIGDISSSDINNDGYDDIIIGVPFKSFATSNSEEGEVFIINIGDNIEPSASPSVSATPTASSTASAEPTPTASTTPTLIASTTPTVTPSSTISVSPSPTPSVSGSASASSTVTASPTPSVTTSATASLTPTPTSTTSSTVSAASTPSVTPSEGSSPSSTPSTSASSSSTASVSVTPTPEMSSSSASTSSTTPSTSPTLSVTPSPSTIYNQIEVDQSGDIAGDDNNDRFIINADNVVITSGAGEDLFVINMHADWELGINDFNTAQDRIDLTAFTNINGIDDIRISNEDGNKVIELPDEQVITLDGMEAENIDESIFIFADDANLPSSSLDPSNHKTNDEDMSNAMVAGLGVLGGVVLTSIVGFVIYYCKTHSAKAATIGGLSTAAGSVADWDTTVNPIGDVHGVGEGVEMTGVDVTNV